MPHIKIIPVLFLLMTITACGPSGSVPATDSSENQSNLQEITTAYPPLDQAVNDFTQPTATPTLAPLLEPIEGISPPIENGELEIRIPFDIYNPAVETPGNPAECITTLPFTWKDQQGRTMVEGQELIQCEFTDNPKDTPITYHVLLAFDAIFSGELLPATPEYPHGWLDSYLNLLGTVTQYYEGYPPEATNPCPQSDPCQTPAAEVIPLPFPFQDGSQISTPWTFILHLPSGDS